MEKIKDPGVFQLQTTLTIDSFNMHVNDPEVIMQNVRKACGEELGKLIAQEKLLTVETSIEAKTGNTNFRCTTLVITAERLRELLDNERKWKGYKHPSDMKYEGELN